MQNGTKFWRNADDCFGNRRFIWYNKIPEIARGLGQGVRKMKDAMEDVKSEIMKETDNPVSEIKREIEKKKAAQEYDPTEKIKQELDLRKQIEGKSSDELIQESKEEINKLSDEYQYRFKIMEEIILEDKQAMIFLNNLGSSTFDPFWILVSEKWFWIPLYIIFLYFLYKNFNKKSLFYILLFVALELLLLTKSPIFLNLDLSD